MAVLHSFQFSIIQTIVTLIFVRFSLDLWEIAWFSKDCISMGESSKFPKS